MDKVYKYVEFISDSKKISEFNLQNGHLHIVYNFNHLPDRSSAMSVDKFHLHLNYWTGQQLKNLMVEKVGGTIDLIDLIDPTVLLASDIMDYELDFKEFNFVNKINFSIDSLLINRAPIGIELKLKNGWETIKTIEFIHLLKYIHEKLMDLDMKYYSLFTGANSYPKKWERAGLVEPKEFNENLKLMDIPIALQKKLKIFHATLKNVTPQFVDRLRKKPKLLNKHIIISALNYSISIYSNNRNKSNEPIINSDDVRLLIQVKKFSPSGGAGQTFIPGLASLVNIDREKTFMTNEEISTRETFQNMYLSLIKS